MNGRRIEKYVSLGNMHKRSKIMGTPGNGGSAPLPRRLLKKAGENFYHKTVYRQTVAVTLQKDYSFAIILFSFVSNPFEHIHDLCAGK